MLKIKNATQILVVILLFLSCTKDTVNVATIEQLDCSSQTVSAEATSGLSFAGTINISYTGGNGLPYTGLSVSSTGVSGLTATLSDGSLNDGSGSLAFSVTGTPTSSGTASFALSFLGQSCTLTLTVDESSSSVSSLTNASTLENATENASYTATLTLNYSGGNGGQYGASSASSTGVEGLTASLDAGTLSNGSGVLEYQITGTPTSSGTASFDLNFGGQSCQVDITVDASETGSSSGTVSEIIAAIDAFKATLSSSQISSLQLSLTKTLAIRWTNLPGGVSNNRNGLEYSTLTSAQLEAALKVVELASGTSSNEGYDEFTQIRLADTYLGTQRGGYSEGLYIIAILGTPSMTGDWILQFGGHHYAQNVSFSNGEIVSNTPSHQGVEPLSWTSNGTTYAPLKEEHAAMLAMLSSFSTDQLSTAKLSTTFSDVLLGPGMDGQFPSTKAGVKVSTMSNEQKTLVLEAISKWVDDLEDEASANLFEIYTNELDDTYVSYSGNASLSNHADYVRIDGPSVWIELVCQNGVVFSNIHYHTIFRDHSRDYNGL
ncbi:DUF3500 domain-containing protein [Marinilongibacter aquaticus]|uniref:DUF3500 domain-containing protein n=1 Tax=Marinilongibacter aquaticus TaxID=2975157 RepID=UPI0021BD89C6|nr:DUF3500 domain-containing protein [Marinilongibacter aquaticus]UBM58657.1 DUF3500 domain-containing protein [Marinilongibacter aquaticus]